MYAFKQIWIFLTNFYAIPQYKISWKFTHAGSCADICGWTDITKLKDVLFVYAKTPEIFQEYNSAMWMVDTLYKPELFRHMRMN